MKSHRTARASRISNETPQAAPAKRKVIHMQTIIQTVFGILDEEGNVIEQKAVQASLQKVNADTLAEYAAQLPEIKAKLESGQPLEAESR